MLTNLFDKITRVSIRVRWLVLIIALIILAAGVYAVLGMNLELIPPIEFPQTIVVAQWPDAESSDQFLEQVTIPLEENLATVEGVVNVESTTSPSFAFIVARNEFGLNQDKILEEIEAAIAKTSLPEGVEPPQVLNFSLSDLPVVTASGSSNELTLPELKELVSENLVPRLEDIEGVSQVTVSGGQEIPGQEGEVTPIVEEPVTEVEEEPEDAGKLPFLFIQGAKLFDVDVEYAQDVSPELLANLLSSNSATVDQVVAILQLVPAGTLRYAPPETLALLPSEFIDTLEPEDQATLDEIAADYGGIGQFTYDEAVAELVGPVEEPEPTAEPTVEPTKEPVQEEVVEVEALPAIEPVALPESWIAAATQFGQDLTTTADVKPEVMEAIVGFTPEMLAELTPAMWIAIDPAAVAIALPEVADTMDKPLLAQLAAIQLAANGEAPKAVDLPESWKQAAGAAGFTLETTDDITPDTITPLATAAPQLLDDLTPEMLLAFNPAVLAALPEDYISGLDEDLQQTLLVVAYLSVAEEASVEVEPVELPESWITAASQAGQVLATTADLTPESMQTLANFAPELLEDLEPSMWRAIEPEVLAVALPIVEDSLDPSLLAQLQAILLAATGEEPEAVELPESWVQAASMAGQTLETTADIDADGLGLLASSAPQLLDDLTEEIILAFSPEVQAALPAEYVATLDEELQETLAIIAIRHANFLALDEMVEEEETVEATPEPEPSADPALLPDVLIQGAQSFGVELQYAYDITPDFMRQMTAFGPQAMQIFDLLSDDNLRAMQPEVIALLPAEFLDGLDPELLAELDELAAEFGGAGALALEEAQAESEPAPEVDADAPALVGPWIEPGIDGSPSPFQTAGDLINNSFVPTAAALLNFFPESPQVEDPVEWMSALTPEILAYLAENEEGFVSNLSPVILEMMSTEGLAFLLEEYESEFEPDVAERLRGIVAGDVEVFVPEATITRTDGNPALVMNLFKDGDANTVDVAHLIFDELAAFEEENSAISFRFVFEQATFIEDSINGVAREGLLGGFFAILVILVFLSGRKQSKFKLSWRATIVVGVSIPLSIATAFVLFRLIPPTLGAWINNTAADSGNSVLIFIGRLFPPTVSLNIMTLSGLTVAIGRVVDDSIVVLENIYRFIQRGESPASAAVKGTREVGIAIFASTATTAAVFLPLGLVGGLIGSFFLPFALSVTYALAASFFVAITVVPALAVILIREKDIPDERESAMQRAYTPWLKWSLGHRGITMLVAVIIFFGSLFLVRQLPQSFIPALGEPTINVAVNLNGNIQMIETDVLVSDFEAALAEVEGIETIQSEVGSGGGVEAFFGGGGINQGQANVTVSVEEQDNLTDLTNEIRESAEAVFGAENVTVSAASQTGFSGFSLTLTGDSTKELEAVADDVKAALSDLDNDGDGRPDITNVSSNIEDAAVGNNGTIVRIDGRPGVSFSGELETADTLGVTAAAKEAINNLETLPDNVEVTEGFESEQQTEGFRGMITAIGYAIVIVYLILALSFKSLIQPFTILFSLPFALVGAVLALWITNSVLGISSMIGLMMLVGIVVTNAIVLMEYVQQLRNEGSSTYDSLVRGGRTRLRPIWMTALATVLALTPLALSQEGGALIASDLAITVIGGLLVSTLLTLIVVPVMYSLIDQLGSKIRRKPVETSSGAE